MKAWLTKHKAMCLYVLVLVVTCVVFFALGYYVGEIYEERGAYIALWEAITDLPDPERCALCGGGIHYHAPCLLNLSTGQIGEMAVYTPHRSIQGEIAPMEKQQTGTFDFYFCAGLMGVRDTSNHTCKVTLPAERELMDPAFFCRECRVFLAGVGLEGYLIVDLYDLAHIQVYPIRDNVIRDYQIFVTDRKDGSIDVCVTGLLE